ncbi:MAG: hypothetical protein RMJ28_00385 [Nitrososphaerota archaeon]|nr:hypothetical protein [Candidatus Calditenuaceae archaeon]MDW8072690.1 hypothetical protein [Nitrososphaerota archaeon]
MGSLKMLIALITVAWASLVAVLITISAFILPLAHGIETRLLASLTRLGLSLILFAVWLVWLFELALYASLKLSRGRRSE